jgi:hypothetical protein
LRHSIPLILGRFDLVEHGVHVFVEKAGFSQVHVRAAEIAVVEREPDLASGPGQFVWDENPPLLGARGRDGRARSGKIKCCYWS